jgi:pimeloyl-ACP methyl ester carboxylesterase
VWLFCYRTFPNGQEIVYGDASTISSTSFDPNVLTVILIHGFTDNGTIHLPADVMPAYLASSLNYNYIVVDWGLLSANAPITNPSQQLESPTFYPRVVSISIPIVANRTTQFIQFLNLNPALVHIVGHSLGSHVSGLVGSNYQANNGGKKFARITGLDPAGLI